MTLKYIHYGSKMVEIAYNLAAVIFNARFYAIKIMETLDLMIRKNYKTFADSQNAIRLKKAEWQSLGKTKKAHTTRKEGKTKQ